MGRDLQVPYPHKWVTDSGGYHYQLNRGCCIICGIVCWGRRKTFCSQECLHKYWDYYVWAGIKTRILVRDNFTCQDCGYKQRRFMWETPQDKPRVLHVHHIKPVKEGGTSVDSNLITLCKNCHLRWHRRGLKQNTTLEDFLKNKNINFYLKTGEFRKQR